MRPATQPAALTDARGRSKRKLRVSLTDRCNLRCSYCMPESPRWMARDALLSDAERLTLIELFVSQFGIDQIRLTGGEPLLRSDLEMLISGFTRLRRDGLQRISLTTNAIGLTERIVALKNSGLDDVNVSLDAVDAETFRRMTRRDALTQVIEGIDACIAAGVPVKLNAVIVRNQNDDQVLPLTEFAADRGVPLRFIEFMPLDGQGQWHREQVVSEAEILNRIERHYSVQARPRDRSPASTYRLDEDIDLGVIPTVTRPFCSQCDRLRLTADGRLLNCLFSEDGPSLRDLVRAGTPTAEISEQIRSHVWRKEAGYVALDGYVERPLTMHAIGG